MTNVVVVVVVVVAIAVEEVLHIVANVVGVDAVFEVVVVGLLLGYC